MAGYRIVGPRVVLASVAEIKELIRSAGRPEYMAAGPGWDSLAHLERLAPRLRDAGLAVVRLETKVETALLVGSSDMSERICALAAEFRETFSSK